MRLEYLTCPTCGAPTPLLGGHPPQCVYCAALIDVPSSIQTPIMKFRSKLRELEQRALAFYADPGERLSNALVLLMALVIYWYVFWWWDSFVSSWSSLDSSTKAVVLQLLALPPGLLFLNWLFSSGEYFRKAKLAFAKLTFDVTSLAKAKLSCPRCAAPLSCKETRAIVVSCRHCDSELLIPSLLLSVQLHGTFRRVMDMRGKNYNRYEIVKWVLIAATAFNGIFPMVVLPGNGVESSHLVYLTSFAWAYMADSIFAIWVHRKWGIGPALAFFVMYLPLPAFFLFHMTCVLLGLDPTRLWNLLVGLSR